jgi:hypothetical protein
VEEILLPSNQKLEKKNIFVKGHDVGSNRQPSSSKQFQRVLTLDQEQFFDVLDENIYGALFVEKLRDLQEYKNQYGTCNVPKRYAANPALGKLMMIVAWHALWYVVAYANGMF